MSLLGFDMDNIPDAKLLDKGEYELKCVSAKSKQAKTGRPMIVLALQATAEPTAETIFHNLLGRAEGDEAQTALRFARDAKAAYQAFGVDLNSSDLNAFVGRTAWANVDTETTTEFGTQNVVKSWTRKA